MAGPFLSHSGLAEHASQFDFPRMGRLAFALAVPPDGFFLYHRDSRPIHLHVEDTNWLADNPGQFQLQGFLDLGLFPLSDIGPDGFRAALDRFRSYFQPGQNFHLLAAVIERCLLAYQGLHAAHPGENSVFWMSSSISAGNWPRPQYGHKS